VKAADVLIDALRSHAPAPSAHTRTLRVCVAGRREFGYLPMGGAAGQAVVDLEEGEELDRLMRETPGGAHV
jgi:hypothetical protein